jgi:NAD-dependent DNA ligase
MEKGPVRRNAEALFEHLQVSTEELIEPDFKVCITGELDQTRDELAAYFAEQGIELVDTLTKDCQALIVGQKPGKAKLSKATALGIFMVTASKASSVDNLIEQIKNRN